MPRNAFNPPPKVHSTVVRLVADPQAEKLSIDPDGFVEFLKLSFGQKRKTLVNNLKARYDDKAIKAALEKAKVLVAPSEREHRIRKALDAATRTVPGLRWRADEEIQQRHPHGDAVRHLALDE